MLLKKGAKYQDNRTRRYIYILHITDKLVQVRFLSNEYKDWYTNADFVRFFTKCK